MDTMFKDIIGDLIESVYEAVNPSIMSLAALVVAIVTISMLVNHMRKPSIFDSGKIPKRYLLMIVLAILFIVYAGTAGRELNTLEYFFPIDTIKEKFFSLIEVDSF